MRFVSTKGQAEPVGIAEALRRGAAPDGGLFMPEHFPQFGSLRRERLDEFAGALLEPFFADDPLRGNLAAACKDAFAPEPPLIVPDETRPQLRILELFHGPTGAFKDYGARFLLALLDAIGTEAEPLTVLAATSGDTGAAVASAAEGRSGASAVILFPEGRVSPFQKLQLSCWNEPVRSIEVQGDFDDCQRLVKLAFQDADLSRRLRLTSANSISIGRLFPQVAYIAHTATRVFDETGVAPGFIIPTGNFGHALAALLGRALGLPVGPVLAVTNANTTLYDWHRSGVYSPRASVQTIANAMDVGAPSNFERLSGLPAEAQTLLVDQVDDATIKQRIVTEYRRSGYVWDPHAATAAEAFARLPERTQSERVWIACGTAHPFKFAEVVEPLIGRAIEPPEQLAGIMHRQSRYSVIPARLEALVDLLLSSSGRLEQSAA